MSTPLSDANKVASIIAFLAILFGENFEIWETIMQFSPEYLIEKYDRYMLSPEPEFNTGLHEILKSHRFQRYMDKWEQELEQ